MDRSSATAPRSEAEVLITLTVPDIPDHTKVGQYAYVGS